MEWIGWILFIVLLGWHFMSGKAIVDKLNCLNEYVQVLLIHDKLYEKHKGEYLQMLKILQVAKMTPKAKALASYDFLEKTAMEMSEKTFEINAILREKPKEDKE